MIYQTTRFFLLNLKRLNKTCACRAPDIPLSLPLQPIYYPLQLLRLHTIQLFQSTLNGKLLTREHRPREGAAHSRITRTLVSGSLQLIER